MAKVKKETPAAPEVSPPRQGGSRSLLVLVPPLLNTLGLLGALGFLVYSTFLFKKKSITEESERERLALLQNHPAAPSASATLNFEPITVNIQSTPQRPDGADGTSTQLQGKLHYATIGFALDLKDSTQKDFVKSLSPLLLDRLISLVGQKQFHELTTVQGRYILHSQFLDEANKVVTSALVHLSKESLITNVYFTQFIVQ